MRPVKWGLYLLAASPNLVALMLLGVLLVVSTQPGDAAARRLNVALHQASELASRILSLHASTASLNSVVDPTAIAELEAVLIERIAAVNESFVALYPQTQALGDRVRTRMTRWFNSIDTNASQKPDASMLRAQFDEMNTTVAEFRSRTAAVEEAHANWSRIDNFVDVESRSLIGELRARGADAAADRLFSAAQRFQERLVGTYAMRPEEVDQLFAGLSEALVLAGLEDGASRVALIVAAARNLHAARETLDSAVRALAGSPLPVLLIALNERMGIERVRRLSTSSDARFLLNVYTALLLLVLFYFGLRLRSSYAELERSHESLELRVESRTRDLVRANNDLKESQVQLVQAEKMSSLGQLVAGIMHEINTPLLYVRSNVDTCAENTRALADEFEPTLALARALSGGDVDKDKIREYLIGVRKGLDPSEVVTSIEEIGQLTIDTQEGLEQITELVQSLKDFSRLDRADVDVFDVREGLERTLVITRNQLKYGVEVIRDFGEVPRIRCAPSRLNQVFINLIMNAVQAMDGKGRLELITKTIGDEIQITIKDSGSGIAPENLAKVTEPFFTTKSVGQGTGLGMSIVKQIIDEHGGRLEIDSKIGVGTAMIIALPVESAGPGRIGSPMEEVAV